MTIKTARWITLGALFLITFLPLVVANGMYFPFITGKGFLFRILVEVAFAGWAVLAFADKKYRPQFSWTLALYGILVVWMAIADAFAVNPHKAFWSNFERMDGWVTLIHVFLFFIVAGSALSATRLWKRWWQVFLGVSAVVCLYGLLQVGHVLQIHQGGVRVDATFGNAAYLAAYLLFAIAIALWQAIESKGWMRYLLSALVALQVLILFYTETRGAILGAVGAVALGTLLWILEAGKKGRRAAGGVLLALLILVGVFFAFKDAPWLHALPGFTRLSSISLAEGAPRLAIWNMALHGVAERPVAGWGQEGFNYVFQKHYEPSMYNQEPWFDRAHNLFLDWAIAGGIPALLLFLLLLASAVVALYRGTASRSERVLLIAALAAYAFQGLFVFDNLLTYVPLAAVLALAHASSSRPIKKLEDLPELPDEALTTGVAPAAVIIGVALVWMVNVPGIRAAGDLIRALSPSSDPNTNLAYFKKAIADGSFADQEIREQLVSLAEAVASYDGVSASAKKPIFDFIIAQMEEQMRETPHDARLRFQYAAIYHAVGDDADAEAQLKLALTEAPKKQQLLMELGKEKWDQGDTAAARDYFDQAYRLDTSFADVASYAAAGHIITNDPQGANAILAQAYGTTTVDADILVSAYYSAKRYNDLIALEQLRADKAGHTPQAQFNLALAYAIAGRLPEARAIVRGTIAAHPEAAAAGAALLAQFGASNK